MKLTICYTTFNGLELLEKSIRNVYDLVDNVIICHQRLSNTGFWELEPKVNKNILRMLENEYPKVKVDYFTPKATLKTKENERNKHNFMVQWAKRLGSTHFILAACDHFYKKDEFLKAKNFCLVNNFDLTLTKMFTYYKHVNWQISPIENYFMPFIMKMNDKTEIGNSNYPVLVDPSVKLNAFNDFHVFDESEIMLHHFSMVRIDILDKFTNAAASIRWTPDQVLNFIDEYEKAKPGDQISYFQNRKILEVEKNDEFDF